MTAESNSLSLDTQKTRIEHYLPVNPRQKLGLTVNQGIAKVYEQAFERESVRDDAGQSKNARHNPLINKL